jgi:AAA domain
MSEIKRAHVAEVSEDGDYVIQLQLEDGAEQTVKVPEIVMTSRAMFERATKHKLPPRSGNEEFDRAHDPFAVMLDEMYAEGVRPSGVSSARVLRLQKYAPLTFIIPKLLPEGMSLIGGKPKVGKSWLALQMAMAIASGGTFLKQRVAQPRKVLYLALEDSPRRLKDRINALGGLPAEAELNLLYSNTWQPLDDGGLELLAAFVDSHHVSTVFIDVLQKLRTPGGKTSENAYERDYRAMTRLHHVSQERKGLAVVAIHHHRKGESEDFVEAMSGSYGLTGVVDTVISLDRPRAKEQGSLQLTARDGEELDWLVNFGGGEWTFSSDRDAVETEEDRDVDVAAEALRRELASGPVPAKTAKANLTALGVTARQLKAAKKQLGIAMPDTVFQLREDGVSVWMWKLPDSAA